MNEEKTFRERLEDENLDDLENVEQAHRGLININEPRISEAKLRKLLAELFHDIMKQQRELLNGLGSAVGFELSEEKYQKFESDVIRKINTTGLMEY